MRREYDWDEETDKKKIVTIVLALATVLAVIVLLFVVVLKPGQNTDSTAGQENGVNFGEDIGENKIGDAAYNKENSDTPNSNDSEMQDGNMTENDTFTEEKQYQPITRGDIAETTGLHRGIDVSRYQGTIDWNKVAASGVEFAMIRVGYRKSDTGEIKEDANARFNLQEATKNGIQVGVYFFSTAITTAEAVEEADWVTSLIAPYAVTYPVAFNYEGYENGENRQSVLTKDERSMMAMAFMNAVYDAGYTPMFYASKWELEGDNKWNASSLEKTYKMWVSYYPDKPYPETQDAGYAGQLAMWQYTNQGNVDGISGNVDCNLSYFGFAAAAEPKDAATPDAVGANPEASMHFTEVEETVTAKDATNLRDLPNKENSTVLYTLKNGQTAKRTAVSTEGWSRLEYEGQICYAVSQYLTTDLSYTPPKEQGAVESDDGIKTVFTECSDKVSPKMSVNLRTLPSVTNPDSQVVVELQYGQVVERTGYNKDYGWSRVVYEGQTLYCITSYVYVVE